MWYLPVREVWLDESHSALLAGMPIRQLLSFVRGDVHPPLYFLLLRGWTSVMGDAPWALRGFSVLATTAAGIAFAALALKVFGRRPAAVLAAWLFWLSPVLFYYSVEVRMYALAILWWILTLTALDQILRSPAPSRRMVLGLVLAAVAAFYTHYAAVFALLGLFAFWMVEVAGKRALLRPLLIAGTGISLLCLPWLPVLLQQREAKAGLRGEEMGARSEPTSLSFGTDSNPDREVSGTVRSALENAASVAGVFPSRHPVLLGLFAIPLVIPLGLGISQVGRFPRVRQLLWVSALVLGGGLLAGITARRFLIFLVPVLVLALTEVLDDLATRRRRSALVLGLALVVIYGSGTLRVLREPDQRPTEAVVATLRSGMRPGDVVVVSALYYEILLEYHAHQAGVELRVSGFPVSIRDWWARQPFKGWGGPAITEADLAGFVGRLRAEAGGHTVWLVLFENRYYDPRHRLLSALTGAARSVTPLLPSAATAGQQLYRIDL